MDYEYSSYLKDKILEFLPSNVVKYSDRINMRCPICGDSRKDANKKRGWLYFTPNNVSYYCFNCSTALSGIKFLLYVSGLSYSDIKKEYVRLFLKSGMNSNLSSYSASSDEVNHINLFNLQPMVKPEWKKPLSLIAKQYLDKRLVTASPFCKEKFYSWYTKKNNDEYILIPWTINGTECYYQLNDFLKHHDSMKYIFPKDAKKMLYGLDNVNLRFPYIICTEGVYDSLFLPNGVALGTKAITDYQLLIIKTRYPSQEIVLSFDNDEAGITALKKYMSKYGNLFKYFIWFDRNTEEKDINELILSKNDPAYFSDYGKVKDMIISPLQAKLRFMNF